jgi:hypothetical protein
VNRAAAATLGGAVLLGALSTAYDAIWAAWIPRHRMIYGLVHGMTLLSAAGGVLGWHAGRIGWGLAGGAAAGLLAAASFYLAAYFRFGYLGALIAAWIVLWQLFAVLNAQLAEGIHHDARRAGARGLTAAVFSGTAFWLISGIWTEHEPGGPDYLWNFACWTFAYLPGFAALLLFPGSPARAGRSHPAAQGGAT